MDLAETIDLARTGDNQAFDRLVEGYRDMALGYARSLVRDREAAEDAVQEALVVVHRNLHRLADSEAFGAWLRGIVRNRCLRGVSSPAFGVASETPVFDPEESGQVLAAVARLPEALRTVVHLHYAEGLSQAEIAQRVGVSKGTVNMRLHAARARLRRRLIMLNETSPTSKTGRVESADGPLVSLRFAPSATPFIFGKLISERDELCVVRALPDGFVQAVAPSGIWTPGREVIDTGDRFEGSLPDDVVVEVALRAESHTGGSLATGIKTLDLFAPLVEGGRTGIFAEWGVGTLVLMPELMHRLEPTGKRHSFFVFMPAVRSEKEWRDINAEVAVGSKRLEVMYLPVEDPLLPSFRSRLESLDCRVLLSRYLAEQGIWPCIDPLHSASNGSQSEVAEAVRSLLRRYFELQSVEAAGSRRLTVDEWTDVRRARLAMRFLSQPFFVAEPFTKTPGAYADVEVAAQTFTEILSGSCDDAARDRFLMAGDRPKAAP